MKKEKKQYLVSAWFVCDHEFCDKPSYGAYQVLCDNKKTALKVAGYYVKEGIIVSIKVVQE